MSCENNCKDNNTQEFKPSGACDAVGLGVEDLLLGKGEVPQIRNGKKVYISKISSHDIPHKDTSIELAINKNSEHLRKLDPYGRANVTSYVQRNFGNWEDAYVERDIEGCVLPGQDTVIKQRIIFAVGDIVKYNDVFWVAVKNNPEGAPTLTNEDWQPVKNSDSSSTVVTSTDGSTIDIESTANGTGNIIIKDANGNTTNGIKFNADGTMTNLATGQLIPDYEVLNYTTADADDSLIISYNIDGKTSGLSLQLGVLELDGHIIGNTATIAYKVEVKNFVMADLVGGHLLFNIDILKPLIANSSMKDIAEQSYGPAMLQPYTVHNRSVPIISSWGLIRPETGMLFNQIDTSAAIDDDSGSSAYRNEDVNRVVYSGMATFKIVRD